MNFMSTQFESSTEVAAVAPECHTPDRFPAHSVAPDLVQS